MKQYNVWQTAAEYTKLTIKAWFQYKIDAVLRSLAVFLRESTGIIVIYFTLIKFDSLNGWNGREIFFLYSLLFLTYGILIIFLPGCGIFRNIYILVSSTDFSSGRGGFCSR